MTTPPAFPSDEQIQEWAEDAYPITTHEVCTRVAFELGARKVRTAMSARMEELEAQNARLKAALDKLLEGHCVSSCTKCHAVVSNALNPKEAGE